MADHGIGSPRETGCRSGSEVRTKAVLVDVPTGDERPVESQSVILARAFHVKRGRDRTRIPRKGTAR